MIMAIAYGLIHIFKDANQVLYQVSIGVELAERQHVWIEWQEGKASPEGGLICEGDKGIGGVHGAIPDVVRNAEGLTAS